MPEVGDEIQVVATKVEQATRSGVVTDVRGGMLTVQWATGDQSVFVPGPGTLTVLGRANATRRGTTVSARTSRGARGAPARRSTTKATARKAPVRKTAKKRAAVRKTAKKRVAKPAGRKAPVRKTAKKRVAKPAARKAPVRKTAKKRVAKPAARKRV